MRGVIFNLMQKCSSKIEQDKMRKQPKHSYKLEIYNGRVKVYIDGYIAFCFNQLDFKGFYAYKDDTQLYGIDVYLMGKEGGRTEMEVYFKTKEVWLEVLKLLDERL